MKRNNGENFLPFCERATNALVNGDVTYSDWCSSIIGEPLYGDENLRRCGVFFKKFLEVLDKEEIKELNDDQRIKAIEEVKENLLKERKKLQTVNSEYITNIRGKARFEMFNERIREEIANLPKIKFTHICHDKSKDDCVGILCIADAHYGTEIEMKSLFDEVVNVYSPEILKARLNKLLDEVDNDNISYVHYDKLVVFDLGDAIQGMLRMSDLNKLKTGVIESTLGYAEMISQWLVELSNRLQVPLEYICLGGNHAELRLLEKGRNWEEENLGRVIREFIALRLKDNPNITIAPYSEFGYKNIQGLNILAIHGDDVKSDLSEVSYWENYHNIQIDILLMGHEHHGEQNTVGYGATGDKEVIKVPSLVGVDTYSKKLRKLARAGAKFMLIEDGSKTWEKTYYLN